MNPRTIKIFLAEGNPTGIKILELSNWSGKGYMIPRNTLKKALEREELKSQAVYFLIGKNDDDKEVVYIGESENFNERILYHQKNKDFWNVAICFISKDDNLNKAHVKYLEAILTNDLKSAGRVLVEAGKTSNKSKLSEAEIAESNEFAENLKMILSAMGFTFLKKPTEGEKENEEFFTCSGKGIEARGLPTTEGFALLRNSFISGIEAESLSTGTSVTRWQLLRSDKVRKDKDSNNYELLEDIIFGSPSYAASVVLGNNVNGWDVWKNKDGKTLNEIKRKSI